MEETKVMETVESEEVACESLANIPDADANAYVSCEEDGSILGDVLRGVFKVVIGIGVGYAFAKKDDIKDFFEERRDNNRKKKEAKQAKKDAKRAKKSNHSDKNKETEAKAEDANFEECSDTEEAAEPEEPKAPAKKNNKK